MVRNTSIALTCKQLVNNLQVWAIVHNKLPHVQHFVGEYFSVAYRPLHHYSRSIIFYKMFVPILWMILYKVLEWSCTKFLPHFEILSLKVKSNMLMMSTSIVSMLSLITFLKILMWALGLVSFTYVGCCSFLHNNLLIGSSRIITDGYHGGMNILGSCVDHPYVPTSGLGGSFPSGSP